MPEPRFPLATVAAGWVAEIDGGAILAPAGASWTARWWVAEGDSWRQPSTEPTVRTRLIDEMGVVETAVRVASGDVVSRARAFVPAGTSSAAIGIDIANDTPIPVAVAVVIGPVHHAELRGEALSVDGQVVARFARHPSRWAGASTLDELSQVVTPEGDPDGELHFESGGWVAVVTPVPHQASLEYVIGLDTGENYPVPPSAEQVASGWSSHADRGARIEPADPNDAASLRRGRALLAGVLLDDSTPLATVAAVGRAAVRLGWDDQATLAAGLLADAQDGRGAVGDPDTTVAAVDVWAGRWRLGATPDEMEPALLPIASAVTSLTRGRGLRRSVPAFSDPSGVLRSAAAMAESLEQSSLARGLVHAAEVAQPHSPERSAPGPGPWGVAHDDDGSVDVGAVAQSVCDLVDALVEDRGRDVALLQGWQVDQAGTAVECHAVPTSVGLVSFAVRWHGRRPALLWEVAPWPGRPAATLRTPRLDPTWSTTTVEGDALLAEPDGIGTTIANATLDVVGGTIVIDGPAEGTSFS